MNIDLLGKKSPLYRYCTLYSSFFPGQSLYCESIICTVVLEEAFNLLSIVISVGVATSSIIYINKRVKYVAGDKVDNLDADPFFVVADGIYS